MVQWERCSGGLPSQILKEAPSNAKRNYLESGNIVSIGINSSRRITEDDHKELQDKFGFVKCDSNCDDDDGVDISVVSTTTMSVEALRPTEAMPQDSVGDAKLPQQTQNL